VAVAVYVRVSTEEQRERQSIRTQLEFGERYCQLHGLTVFRIYSDDGISGTVPLEKRPEGSQILRDVQAGKFDQLLVYRLDRLGRETRLILNAVAELEKLGVRIKSMTEEFDITFYQKATNLNPNYATPYNGWGVALANQGKYAEAITFYQKATDLNPKFAQAYDNWGMALDALGKHAEAEEERRRAAEIDQSK